MKELFILWQESVGFGRMSRQHQKKALIYGVIFTGAFVIYLISYWIGIILVVISAYSLKDSIPVRE